MSIQDRQAAELRDREEEPRTVYVSCPFCNEADFDLIGLRLHLLRGWCEAFNALEGATDD